MKTKKVLAILLGICMNVSTFSAVAFANEEITDNTVFDLDFTGYAKTEDGTETHSAGYEVINDSKSGWKVLGNWVGGGSPLFEQPDGIRIGHIYGSPYAGIEKDFSNIGISYDYTVSLKRSSTENGGGVVSEENLSDGTYYTARTKITNGYYLLDFSVEGSGVYAVSADDGWHKAWSGDGLADNQYHTYKASVEGSKAEIYRDNEIIISYTMPMANNSESKLEFGRNGTGWVDGQKAIGGSPFVSGLKTENTKKQTKADKLVDVKWVGPYVGVNDEGNKAEVANFKTLWDEIENDYAIELGYGNGFYINCGKTQNPNDGGYGYGTVAVTKNINTNIGSNYVYSSEYKRAEHNGKKSVDSGVNTGRIQISNGFYLLDFCTETDGIFAVTADSDGELTKVSEMVLAVGEIAVFTAVVNDNNAKIYKNNEYVCEYTMPECGKEACFKFSVTGSQMYLRGLSLKSITDDKGSAVKARINGLFNWRFDAENGKQAVEEIKSAGSGWSFGGRFENNNPVQIGHPNDPQSYISTSKFEKPIGDNYKYSMKILAYGGSKTNRLPGGKFDPNSLCSDKITITNGKYLLNASVEEDGIYYLDNSGEWKMNDSVKLTASGQLIAYLVNGEKASVYADGVYKFSFAMPKTESTDSFKFEVNGTGWNNDYWAGTQLYVNSLTLENAAKENVPFVTVTGGKAVVESGDYNNALGKGLPYTVIAAVYDKTTNALCDVKYAEVTPLDYPKKVTVDYNANTQKAYVMIWDSLTMMTPRIDTTDLFVFGE